MHDPSATFALSTAHLATAEKLIARQSHLIVRLHGMGHDVRCAEHLLILFRAIQAEMLRHHAFIERDMQAWIARTR
jgi:hypothetical protein